MPRPTGHPSLVVTAYKGGTGKTTITVNLAGALAAAGRRVLVIDCDQQGGAALALGAPTHKPTLYEALHNPAVASDAIRPSKTPGIDVLVSDIDLSAAELDLPQMPDWQQAIARLVTAVAPSYDVVLLDTPPGLAPVSHAALSAGDQVLIVTTPAFLDLRGLHLAIEQARVAGRPVLGVVPNQVAGHRTTHQVEALDAIGEVVAQLGQPPRLLPAIPERVALRDAAAAAEPISTYQPRSDVAAAFASLAQEVLARVSA